MALFLTCIFGIPQMFYGGFVFDPLRKLCYCTTVPTYPKHCTNVPRSGAGWYSVCKIFKSFFSEVMIVKETFIPRQMMHPYI